MSELKPFASQTEPAKSTAEPKESGISPAPLAAAHLSYYGLTGGAAAGPPALPLGYQQYYALPVQRRASVELAPAGDAAATVQAAAVEGVSGATTALPHAETIQRSFGKHDVGHIVAHTDGAAARGAQAMGAAAFAAGDHVAFAGAPSLHTAAHEAAHVVQQRGGVQLSGGVGEAGDPYEQHADAVAERVVAGGSAEALLDAHSPSPGASGPRVQRLLTQIVQAASDPKFIAEVRIIGRPERVHGSSMGDHTTAFVLHTEAVRTRLRGKTMVQAIGEMVGLCAGLQHLPGMEFVRDLPPVHQGRIAAAYARIETISARLVPLAGGDGAAQATFLLDLQDWICAYLDFRELVPLSTIKTSEKGQGSAGKGKGERAEALAPLSTVGVTGTTPEAIYHAIQSTFDARTVGMVAAERSAEMLRVMAPGLDAGRACLDRVLLMVNQHLVSIIASFPAAFGPHGIPIDEVRTRLAAAAVPRVMERLAKDKGDLERDIGIKSADAKARREQEKGGIGSARDRRVHGEAAAELEDEVTALRARVVEPTALETLVFETTKVPPVVLPKPGAPVKVSAKTVLKGNKRLRQVEEKPKAVEEEVSEEDALAEESRKQPLATQLVLGAGGRIVDVRMEGRSRSPFSGSMGAHTTAWVVHQERIRTALRNCTVDAALERLEVTLVPEVVAMGARLAKAKAASGAAPDDTPLLASIRAARSGSPAARLGLLQERINNLLTFINDTPGATLESTDTCGKGEGASRRILVEREGGTATPVGTLQDAIVSLLDVSTDHQKEADVSDRQPAPGTIRAAFPIPAVEVSTSAGSATRKARARG